MYQATLLVVIMFGAACITDSPSGGASPLYGEAPKPIEIRTGPEPSLPKSGEERIDEEPKNVITSILTAEQVGIDVDQNGVALVTTHPVQFQNSAQMKAFVPDGVLMASKSAVEDYCKNFFENQVKNNLHWMQMGLLINPLGSEFLRRKIQDQFPLCSINNPYIPISVSVEVKLKSNEQTLSKDIQRETANLQAQLGGLLGDWAKLGWVDIISNHYPNDLATLFCGLTLGTVELTLNLKDAGGESISIVIKEVTFP